MALRAAAVGAATCHAFRIALAVRALRAGAVVAYPTEAVFGLGCDPRNDSALERLLATKRRERSKGLILVGATPEQVLEFAVDLGTRAMEPVLESWPGPCTWVLPAAPGVHPLVTGGHGTVAVRVSAHPLVGALCRRYGGALVSTSANRAGFEPARSARQVRLRLGSRVDFVLDGPLGGMASPSIIRDAATLGVLRGG